MSPNANIRGCWEKKRNIGVLNMNLNEGGGLGPGWAEGRAGRVMSNCPTTQNRSCAKESALESFQTGSVCKGCELMRHG